MSKTIYRTEYLYDSNDFPVFKIEIEDPGEYRETSFNAVVSEITSWEADDTKTPFDIEPYLKCYIKWDSCSHLWFDDKDGDPYYHFCGARSFIHHTELLNYLYNLAFEEMGREPFDEYDRWPLDMKTLHAKEQS